MDFPFFNGQQKRLDHIVVLDLGGRTTKAVHLQRRGDRFDFVNFALQDAPIAEKGASVNLLAEHLRNVTHALGARTKRVILTLGVNESLLRHAELPLVPLNDMRMMVKFNSKNYLQQDLTDHAFDCYILPPKGGAKPVEPTKANPKCRVLVGGAKANVVNDLQNAARLAGLTAEQVVPSLVGPVNAFELAQPEAFQKEVVALVDIGFKNTSISIVQQGDLALSRVVQIGGDRLTQGLAEAMKISYAEAESIKVGIPDEVQPMLQRLVMPLGRELRASIDFFEHQHDKTVTSVFVSGGSARSPFIVQTLQEELMVPCKTWNPTGFLNATLPPQQMGEIEQVAPQLTVAIGAAAGAF
jgi:type IV pilus assembly protein PilM